MNSLLAVLLPQPVDNAIRGYRLPYSVFGLIAIVSTVRSLIHMFAPDGGAGSIAGMDLPATGAGGIIFAFALWGSSQLIYAFVQLAVAFRYRSLVPFFYLLVFLETVFRMTVGRMKPVTFSHTPPGATADLVLLPMSLVMLYLALPHRPNASNRRAA